jgi:succinyl-diaminopimelate desuccinylase
LPLDPIPLARRLIQAPSVTPKDAGALDVLSEALEALGFVCERFKFEEVDNLPRRCSASPVIPTWCRRVMTPPGAAARSKRKSPMTFFGDAALRT